MVHGIVRCYTLGSLASHTYFGGSGRNTYDAYGQLFGNNRERFQKLRPRNVMCLVAHAAQLSLSSLSDCLLLTVTQLTIAKKLSCM